MEPPRFEEEDVRPEEEEPPRLPEEEDDEEEEEDELLPPRLPPLELPPPRPPPPPPPLRLNNSLAESERSWKDVGRARAWMVLMKARSQKREFWSCMLALR